MENYTVKKVLISKKPIHAPQLFQHMLYGGGIIDIGHGYSLQIVKQGWRNILYLYKHELDTFIDERTWATPEKKKKEKPKQDDIFKHENSVLEE